MTGVPRGIGSSCRWAARLPRAPNTQWIRWFACAQCVIASSLSGQTPAPVRVWQGTLTLPTYEEGPPDVNPPFDLFTTPGRPNYPYTIRDQLTDRRAPKAWRALFLENEYLKCSVLPDLGGHLYSCTDKVNGQEMFYANSAIKFSNIAYRGSWAAFGIEFNFPVSHNWMSTSPVDFATRTQPDGSATILVGNVDRPYGMQWQVELTLRPGRSLLEQHTTLYNRSDVRRRFYWWTNAAVRAFDDTKILYPMKYTASHGFTNVDTWPVDSRGTDNSVLKNHVYGPVSRFAHGSREGFMAIWNPRTNSGVAHYAAPDELPAKKIWSWGVDADAMDWRRQLSDDSSAYVEVQAGLFRDQETYGFLQPQEEVSFTEYWMPLRNTGGVSKMNPQVAVHMERVPLSKDSMLVRIAVQVSRTHQYATVEVAGGTRYGSIPYLATPDSTLRLEEHIGTTARPLTVLLTDEAGVIMMQYTEGMFDFLPDSMIRTGAQPTHRWPDVERRTEGDWLSYGEDREVNGDILAALGAYRAGLSKNPGTRELLRAAARLAVTLGLFREGDSLASRALAVQPADHEIAYYRGLARLAMGDSARAQLDFEQARQFGPLRAAALLAVLRTKIGHLRDRSEVDHFFAVSASERAPRIREARAIAATLQGKPGSGHVFGWSLEEKAITDSVAAADPLNNVARWFRHYQGAPDDALLLHLAGDPQRILEIADVLIELGSYYTEPLLATTFPDGASVVREPGTPHPGSHPLIAYYHGYARERNGRDGTANFEAAAAMPLTYVFPNGPQTRTVLEYAQRRRPQDQSARYLLGMMAMQRGEVAKAIAMWDTVRATRPDIPALHRNLGYALLLTGDTARALDIFAAGTTAESGNPAVWVGYDSVLALTGRPAAERVASLDRYPDRANMPTALVYRYARLLAETGRYDEAEAMFRDRFLSRVEGGTNPRTVWLEVRLARANALAESGKCADARRVLTSLAKPVAGLAFTRDGMTALLGQGSVARRRSAVAARCSGR